MVMSTLTVSSGLSATLSPSMLHSQQEPDSLLIDPPTGRTRNRARLESRPDPAFYKTCVRPTALSE